MKVPIKPPTIPPAGKETLGIRSDMLTGMGRTREKTMSNRLTTPGPAMVPETRPPMPPKIAPRATRSTTNGMLNQVAMRAAPFPIALSSRPDVPRRGGPCGLGA